MGYRVEELLAYLKKNHGEIEMLKAEGKWALVLLAAKAISEESRFPKVQLTNLLTGYRAMALEDLNIIYSSSYIPGILQHGDIDDMVALCGKGIEVVNRIDSFGRVVKP